MSPRRNELELLSPARTADIGIEAIQHGADAVYIGGPGFGARSQASNSVSDIARLCEHAHHYGARIYATMNTILRDDELEAARRQIWQLYEAGVDALIVQDMGLLELDLPPIELHASTQSDIRSVDKAKFLQDVGFSQIVLARELNLSQIRAIADATHCGIEFFVHGALCVAYSGQCFISHAHTGRSANRGDCSQACRLPYQVQDAQGQIVAYDQHVLSLKDNDQSANLHALVDAGVRSFKIEGRYKDMGYVKNITAHYRQLLDELLSSRQDLRAASDGHCRFSFAPDPRRNFNRGSTDYFVHDRQGDIGAFDSPKHLGLAIGEVARIGDQWFDLALNEASLAQLDAQQVGVHNGDGLNYLNLQREVIGVQVNIAQRVGKSPRLWRVFPNEPVSALVDLRVGLEVHRNRDRGWEATLNRPSAQRKIDIRMCLGETPTGLSLELVDERGLRVKVERECTRQLAEDPQQAQQHVQAHLGKLGTSPFRAADICSELSAPWFIPASVINALRRDAVQALQAARLAARVRGQRAQAVEPPVAYPQDSLSYLANVFNHKAHDFYARHGVKVIEPAYEAHQELGEVSLMITKHCVRFSLSLCPKQAKGVTGVQGQVRAEPLLLLNGKEKLTLRFDCKPCEMHVVGHIKRGVLQRLPAQPITFHQRRP